MLLRMGWMVEQDQGFEMNQSEFNRIQPPRGIPSLTYSTHTSCTLLPAGSLLLLEDARAPVSSEPPISDVAILAVRLMSPSMAAAMSLHRFCTDSPHCVALFSILSSFLDLDRRVPLVRDFASSSAAWVDKVRRFRYAHLLRHRCKTSSVCQYGS